MNKKIYYIGLGKMGKGMSIQLAEKGWDVQAFDLNEEARNSVKEHGVQTYSTVQDLFANKEKETKIVWIMVPYKYVDDVLVDVKPFLQEGDIVIDGGNSPYKNAIRRDKEVQEFGARFMDVGVSGGPEGARNGACLMIGGPKPCFDKIEELFKDIAAPEAYQYLGKTGAGHYIKMVHNGIEYGMMQAIAEGFDLMAQSEFDPELKDIARIYQQQSVVTSRLVGWLAQGFDEYGTALTEVNGSVGALGEGLWTIEAAHADGMKLPAIEAAYDERIRSQEKPTYRGQLLQTMRQMFGGHVGVNKIQS